MKALSDKQIQSCENAVGKTCHCRCGGAFHGRSAGGTLADGSIDRGFFETLPADDPHHILTDAERKAQSDARKEAKRKTKKIARIKQSLAWYARNGMTNTYYEGRLRELEA